MLLVLLVLLAWTPGASALVMLGVLAVAAVLAMVPSRVPSALAALGPPLAAPLGVLVLPAARSSACSVGGMSEGSTGLKTQGLTSCESPIAAPAAPLAGLDLPDLAPSATDETDPAPVVLIL